MVEGARNCQYAGRALRLPMTLELYVEGLIFLLKDSFIFLFGIKGRKYGETAAALDIFCIREALINS